MDQLKPLYSVAAFPKKAKIAIHIAVIPGIKQRKNKRKSTADINNATY